MTTTARKDDGGPAFPPRGNSGTPGAAGTAYWPPREGMSLRDWFAGHALPVILGSAVAHAAKFANGGELNTSVAINCYAFADAMLAARKTEAAS